MHSSLLLLLAAVRAAADDAVPELPLPLTDASSAGSGAEDGLEGKGREAPSGADASTDGCCGAGTAGSAGDWAGPSSSPLLPCRSRRIRASVGMLEEEVGASAAAAACVCCRGGTSVVGRLGGGRGTGSESEGVGAGMGKEAARLLKARAAMTVFTSTGSLFLSGAAAVAAAVLAEEACWISMGGGRRATSSMVDAGSETPVGTGMGRGGGWAGTGPGPPSKASLESAAESSIFWFSIPAVSVMRCCRGVGNVEREAGDWIG